jgi:hypothetical protein
MHSIVLRDLTGKSMMCSMDVINLDAMKACAAKWQQVHPSQLMLLHSGRQLADQLLGSICHQSVVHVVLKPTAKIHYQMLQMHSRAKAMRCKLNCLDKLLQVQMCDINQAAKDVVDMFVIKAKLQQMHNAFGHAMDFIERLVLFNWQVAKLVGQHMQRQQKTNRQLCKPAKPAKPAKPNHPQPNHTQIN